jgi:NitT/TauT family transport system permease protein
MFDAVPEERPAPKLDPVSRAFWGLLGLLRLLLSPLERIFRIREPLRMVTKLALAGLFFLAVFTLWCWATSPPEWLIHGYERVWPQAKVEAGDPIELHLDRGTRKIHVRRAGSPAEGVVELPPLSAAALPPFNERNYPGVFAEAKDFGLGQFAQRDETTVTAKVTDLEKARTSGGFDPMPFRLPIKVGEQAVFTLDPLRGRLTLHLMRDAMRKAQLPYESTGAKRLEEQALAPLVGQMGVAASFQRKDETSLVAPIEIPALFQEVTGLGPSNPIAALAEGEEVLLVFLPQEQSVSVEMPRTEKKRTISVTAAKLSSEALPELSLGAYPGLERTLGSFGVGLEVPPESPPRMRTFVQDASRAVDRGLGLYRPREYRRAGGSIPSPTEVANGLPALWNDRNLMGGWGLSARPPFVTDWSWDRFRDSGLGSSLRRVVIGFLFAVAIALPLGILMGSFSKFYYFFEPLRIGGQYLPLPAFVVLTIFWAGIGEPRNYLFLFICNFVVLLPYTIVAIQSVPQVYLDTGATLGLSRSQIVRRVLIAVAKPEIWKGLRFTFGIGWTWIILAEQIGVDNGLGYIIWTAERRGHPEHVYVVILLIMVLAFLANTLWTYLIHWMFPHERSR